MKMKSLILEEIQKLRGKREINKEKEAIFKEDSVSSKSSHSQISVKSQSTVVRSGLDLFLGFKFCFPLVDVELSPKRIQIISKTIQAERGIVVKYEDKIVSQPIDFVLVSPAAKIQPLLKRLGNKLTFEKILDFNFILKSIRQGVLLSIDKYSLYNSKPENVGEQLESIYVSRTAKKYHKLEDDRKIAHLGNRQWSKHELKTDDQFRSKEQFEVDQISSMKTSNYKPMKLISSCKKLLNGQQRKPQHQISKDLFLCQKSITSDSVEKFSMNKFLCEQLMKLQNIYQSEKDIGRKIAYLKAVSVIKSLPFQIENELDLENVKGIGKKIIAKIQQLINTGKLQKLERLQQNQKNVVETNLCKIWGIGPSKAQQLFKEGIKKVQQLRQQPNLLNNKQRLGLKYYEDFLQKIPREKITAIFSFIKDALKQLVDNSNNYNIEVCGSYRRGKPLCGDIDIIISRKDRFYEKKLLLDLILLLEKKELLIDHLQFPSSSEGKGSQSYMGVCRFQSDVHHRIDIKYYPMQQYAYALLYFTGSDMFNRSMRLYARKVGLQLSDHGAQARRDEKSGAIWQKPIPICADQRSIFEFMGLQYRCPRQRQA